MTTIEIPDGGLPDLASFAMMIQQSMRTNGTSSGGGPAPLDTILDVLLTVRAIQSGPRYVAEYDGTNDSLGNPGYVVRDTRTGEVHSTYPAAYFAGIDARDMAIILNRQEG